MSFTGSLVSMIKQMSFLKLRCDNMPNFKNDSQQFEYTFLLMLWSWLKSLVTLENFINVYIYFENSHAKIILM